MTTLRCRVRFSRSLIFSSDLLCASLSLRSAHSRVSLADFDSHFVAWHPTMAALESLQLLSLVQKVCQELETHVGVNDKDLAEFIIELADSADSVQHFGRALTEARLFSFTDT